MRAKEVVPVRILREVDRLIPSFEKPNWNLSESLMAWESAWGSSKRWLRDESGQVLVMTFFSMALLLGFLGLAIDVGVLFHARRHMQAVADAAAMAGATEMFYNGSTNVVAKANAA